MKKARITAIIATVFILLAKVNSLVYAVSASDKINSTVVDTQTAQLPSVFTLFVKLVISLVVIVLLAYFSLKFLRKNMQTKNIGASIHILDQHAFGLNKGIYVTEIGSKVYVLGVTESNISLVTEINEENVIAQMRQNAAERQFEPVVPTSVTLFIKNLIANIPKKDITKNKDNDFKSHIQAQVNKLQSMFDKGREDKKDE